MDALARCINEMPKVEHKCRNVSYRDVTDSLWALGTNVGSKTVAKRISRGKLGVVLLVHRVGIASKLAPIGQIGNVRKFTKYVPCLVPNQLDLAINWPFPQNLILGQIIREERYEHGVSPAARQRD